MKTWLKTRLLGLMLLFLSITLGTGCLGDSGLNASDSAQLESTDYVRPNADVRPVDDAGSAARPSATSAMTEVSNEQGDAECTSTTDDLSAEPNALTGRLVCFFGCLGAHTDPVCAAGCLACAAAPNIFCVAGCAFCAGPQGLKCARRCL